jgi:hypothetical protein
MVTPSISTGSPAKRNVAGRRPLGSLASRGSASAARACAYPVTSHAGVPLK